MADSQTFPFLQRTHFADISQKFSAGYNHADPFPYAVIDNFLPTDLANEVHDAFPRSDLASFEQPDNAFQVKKLGRTQANDFAGVPVTIRHLLSELNGAVFIDFLEDLTGIKGLIPDPHYQGGALHQILPGGHLEIHADFNRHKRLNLDRRLNVLIYMNKDWPAEYGGNLELWNLGMTKCVKEVAPLFNRCVVFSTTSTSYHGHPKPLTCPPHRTRNSIAMYYYSNGRPEAEQAESHSTLWQKRP